MKKGHLIEGRPWNFFLAFAGEVWDKMQRVAEVSSQFGKILQVGLVQRWISEFRILWFGGQSIEARTDMIYPIDSRLLGQNLVGTEG